MADELADKGEHDRSHIATNKPHELRYWTRHFGVDRDQLQAIVAKVGNSAVAVRKEIDALNARKEPTNEIASADPVDRQ